MSVVATNTMRFGAIIVFFVIMVILNLLSASSCTQLLKEKGEKEREIAKLDADRMRESTRWEEMKTPEKIEMALLRHGLAMKFPRADQTIRLRPDGTPGPGQYSVKLARQRLGVGVVSVGATPAAAPAATKPKQPYRRRRSR